MTGNSINRSVTGIIPEYFSRMTGLDPLPSLATRPARDCFAAQEQSFRGAYLGGSLGHAADR